MQRVGQVVEPAAEAEQHANAAPADASERAERVEHVEQHAIAVQDVVVARAGRTARRSSKVPARPPSSAARSTTVTSLQPPRASAYAARHAGEPASEHDDRLVRPHARRRGPRPRQADRRPGARARRARPAGRRARSKPGSTAWRRTGRAWNSGVSKNEALEPRTGAAASRPATRRCAARVGSAPPNARAQGRAPRCARGRSCRCPRSAQRTRWRTRAGSIPIEIAWIVSSATGSDEHRMRSTIRGRPDFGPFPSSPTVPSISASAGRTTRLRSAIASSSTRWYSWRIVGRQPHWFLSAPERPVLAWVFMTGTVTRSESRQDPRHVDAPEHDVVRGFDRDRRLARHVDPARRRACGTARAIPLSRAARSTFSRT